METSSLQPSLGRFTSSKTAIGQLGAEAAARLAAAAADIALTIDANGVIRDVAIGVESLVEGRLGSLIGKAWVDTVTVESRPKIEELLKRARAAAEPRWRQVNHPAKNGPDIPVRYTAVPTGRNGYVVAMGRDLSEMAALQQRIIEAQLAMEREYSRLRHAETRYRLLFHLASEAVLIVDAGTNRVVEANPAASRVLEKSSGRLVGRSIFELFDKSDGSVLQGLLSSARASGRADAGRTQLSAYDRPVSVSASMFRQQQGAHFLIKIGDLGEASSPDASDTASRSLEVIRELPDGFVVTTPQGHIVNANQAFLELAHVASEEQVIGQPLERWLGRSATDFNVLIGNLKELGAVRHFPTIVRAEYGSKEDVEVSAVSALHADEACLGFVVRSTARRPQPEHRTTRQLPRSMEQLTELIGRTPLKELVRETTDLIERMCIEAALELTGDNRASAAQMLGLSRQSLYVKLRRYGLADGTEGDAHG